MTSKVNPEETVIFGWLHGYPKLPQVSKNAPQKNGVLFSSCPVQFGEGQFSAFFVCSFKLRVKRNWFLENETMTMKVVVMMRIRMEHEEL